MTIHTVSILGISCFLKPRKWGTLLTWQWSRKRSMTPSSKSVSHRRSLLKGVAVQGVLYQSIFNAKLTGRKKFDRKRCTSNGDDRKLENTVKQSRFKHLESFTRSELKLESVHQESPCSGIFKKRATNATSETETSSEASYLG